MIRPIQNLTTTCAPEAAWAGAKTRRDPAGLFRLDEQLVRSHLLENTHHPGLTLLDLGGKETGAYDIAVDTIQAGHGDTALVMDEGNGARQILGLDSGAIRAVVVGVVDEVSVGG